MKFRFRKGKEFLDQRHDNQFLKKDYAPWIVLTYFLGRSA